MHRSKGIYLEWAYGRHRQKINRLLECGNNHLLNILQKAAGEFFEGFPGGHNIELEDRVVGGSKPAIEDRFWLGG